MTDNADLGTLIDSLAAARVLVVGDIMLDRFISGTVERISPESPVPVLRVDREAVMLGGAGNVLRNVIALGARASIIGVVGEDRAGGEVARLIAAEGAETNQVLRDPARRTTVKERYLAGAQQLLRADRESETALSEPLAAELVGAAKAALPVSDVLVLSDYGKGVLPPTVLASLIEAAQKAKRPVVVDPCGRDYAVYRGASVITPNQRELQDATGRTVSDDASAAEACRGLIEPGVSAAVLATRGERGMTLAQGDGTLRHIPAVAREVFDVSGAGDTVVAVLGAGLAVGGSLIEAARLANIAAGIVVGKAGTAVVRPGELRRALHASALLEVDAKLADQDSLADQVERWRRDGLAVGFTNGCFDLLHPGHLHMLNQARQACDRLIVGLNSDSSVRRLKGGGRPVQGETARAAVLASLSDVDRVVIFAEDTPLNLIEQLRPDVLIKGADYRLDQVVGAALVQGYGGRVLLADLLPGHSTSETLSRL